MHRHGPTFRRTGGRLAGLAAAIGLSLAVAAPAQALEAEIVGFEALDGWDGDDHAAALETFLTSCPAVSRVEWRPLCAVAAAGPEPRWFFETFFLPVRIAPDTAALFTGYYEPELPAALVPGGPYRFPIYRVPPDLVASVPYLTRAEIDGDRALAGRGLEIAWLRDPVDIYHLQVQGSGRLRLPDGRVLRLGFGAQNGHPRRPVAQYLVEEGVIAAHRASVAVIRNWVRGNPEAGLPALWRDPSYVFFRVLADRDAASGPLGALNRPLTAGRSVAVDPAFVPLGAPVWLEKDGAEPLRRLGVAQDTGGAIRGPQRADIFMGTGPEAGRAAGLIRDGGRMTVLMPIEAAFVLALGE